MNSAAVEKAEIIFWWKWQLFKYHFEMLC